MNLIALKTKKNILKAILICLAISPATSILAQSEKPAETIFESKRQELRLSEKLQSPKRDDFAHLANYWLENYASRTLNQPLAELLPAMISGPKEELLHPTKRINLLKDLQMLNLPNQKSILNGINRTQTHAGKLSLFTLFATENTNWLAIKERQRFIKLLVDSPQLLKSIQRELRNIQKYENFSLEALEQAEALKAAKEERKIAMLQSGVPGWITLGIINFFEKTFFKFDGANTFFTTLGTTLMILGVPFFGMYAIGCLTSAFGAYFYSTARTEILQNVMSRIIMFGSTPESHLWLKILPAFITATLMAPIWMLCLESACNAYVAYLFYNKLKTRTKILKTSFKTAQGLAQAHKSSQELAKTLNQLEETKNLFPNFLTHTSQQFKALASKLEQSTFDAEEEYSFFATHHGRAENCIELLNSSHDEIGQMRRFYGEIDAYSSMAQFYLDHQETTNSTNESIRCCFAEFIDDSPESILHAHNFWHPIIPIDRVRASSIKLGGDQIARDIVVTGPNAGGKSVNLKALITNLMLAQTFGLACAESFKFTPFTKIIARLKSVDDTSGDKSKFMLEAIEMAGLLKEMMSLKPREHAFVETDELFTGTEVGPAISLSIELCVRIAKMKNVMYVLATHYKELTDLKLITGNVFDNYRVNVFKEPNSHKLVYPYTLTQGIGNTNVAFDIFLEQLEIQGINDETLIEVINKAKTRQESVERAR